jgi:hypothetical protein
MTLRVHAPSIHSTQALVRAVYVRAVARDACVVNVICGPQGTLADLNGGPYRGYAGNGRELFLLAVLPGVHLCSAQTRCGEAN